MSEEYFAAKPREEAVGEIETLIKDYYSALQAKGILKLWNRSYSSYNSAVEFGSTIKAVGDQQELSSIKVNHYRNFIQHLMNLTISQRPAFEPRASNTDVKSQTQTILARGLLDYYMREKRLERNLRKAVEFSLVYSEGYVSTSWNATTGEVYSIDPESGAEIRQGDIQYESHEPFNVIRDTNLEEWENNNWVIIRKQANKHDLSAKYEELATAISAVNSDGSYAVYDYRTKNLVSKNKDLVDVFEFYHKRTDALPDGRLITFIDSSIVLNDGPLPYRSIPLFRVSPADLIGTTSGYTPAYDLLAIQEGVNSLYSTILTNQLSFGVQNIMAPKGNNLSVTQLSGGLNFIEYDGNSGKPEALNLTSTPPEVFNFLNMMEHTMETLSGVNSVARGNPDSSLKSGAALALVQSMSIQFAQQLQQSYVQLLEDVGTSTINILRDYASVPRVATISGKSNRGMMKEFTGEDLSQVNRVIVDAGNPMTRTTAGKVELAQMMLQAGIILNAQQLLQVIQTGNLDTLVEGKTSELLAIKSENEQLVEGINVPVMVTDDHRMHILEHKSTVSDPSVREDPMIVEAVTNHIMDHFRFLGDPSYAQLLVLLGQEPINNDQAALGATPPASMNASKSALQNVPMAINDSVEAQLPNMPSMPTNPLTGEQSPEPQQAL